MKKDITKLFCDVHDFTQSMKKEILAHRLSGEKPVRQPTRNPGLDESEIVTIILLFQESPCRNFEYFYQSYLQLYKEDFPAMPSYQRFVALMLRVTCWLMIFLYCLLGKSKGVSYIDAASLAVCHPKRMSRNRVFKGLAKIGKTTKGYF